MAGVFPVLLNVRGRQCVVVGGGAVAARKVGTLLAAGAEVRVISPRVEEEMGVLRRRGLIRVEAREYREGDVGGAFLCVAATDDAEVNRRVRDDARTRGVLVNVVDDPEGSDYHVPSFFEDGPLLIAVSTGGTSPAVAAGLRRMIQSYLGPDVGKALEFISRFREEKVKKQIASPAERVRFWEEVVTPEFLEAIRRGDRQALTQMLEQALASWRGSGKGKRGKRRSSGK